MHPFYMTTRTNDVYMYALSRIFNTCLYNRLLSWHWQTRVNVSRYKWTASRINSYSSKRFDIGWAQRKRRIKTNAAGTNLAHLHPSNQIHMAAVATSMLRQKNKKTRNNMIFFIDALTKNKKKCLDFTLYDMTLKRQINQVNIDIL